MISFSHDYQELRFNLLKLSVWFGVQFIRQGIYQGGVFRFTITLPQNFPDGKCPVQIHHFLVFLSIIFLNT